MIGRTLSHYRITSKLGAGGMGIVYAAEDSRLGRQVALKFVSSDLAHDEQAVQRLRSEAKAASALNHPNICTIHDIGEDNGHPFIVMELMKGQTLRERLHDGPLKVVQLVDIGIEIADALQAAHSEGIIHRDIKPGNIFLTERGHVKILDFGLAKLTQALTTVTTAEVSPHPTATGVTHGTPAYMSPEQATGEQLDGRSDLFSLGVVLYECATGHHPFPGKTPAVILAGILDRAPISPLAHNPELPPRLSEIISNCLEKDRELRYQSAADLRADLRRLRRDLDSSAFRAVERSTSGGYSGRSESSRSDAVTAPTVREDVTRLLETPAPQRARTGWMLAAVGVVAAVLALVIFQWPRGAPPTPAESPAVSDAPAVPSAAPAAPAAPSTAPASSEASIERRVAQATASLNAGNYRAALTSAREVLALDPNNAAAAGVRDQASSMLARFDREIADARRRLNSGDLEGASRALERARVIDAAATSVAELSARVAEAFRGRENAARLQGREVPAESRREAPAPSTVPSPPAPAAVPPPVPAAPVEAAPTAPVLPPSPAAPQPSATVRPPDTPPRVDPPRAEPPPAAPAADNDDTAIRQVIAAYGRAIEAKDLRLFRSIKPNLTAEEERRLEEGFRAVTSQRVSLTVMSLERKGDRATALVRRRDEIVAGGRKQTTDARQAFTLTKNAAGWVISEIR